MSLAIEFRNFDRVKNALRYLAARQPELTDKIMGDWAKDMRTMLKSHPYPAKRPTQTYVRTGRLANSWAAIQVRTGVWSLTNTATNQKTGAPYAFRVVGDADGENQAWMHEGRWWIARDLLDGYTDDLTQRLTRQLEDYWEKNG